MRIVTITSDNYVPHTRLLINSIRVWHPDIPVFIYSLETGWTDESGTSLEPYGVTIKLLREADVAQRQAGTIKTAFKLDAMLDQDEPFLYMDSDILVLRPLDDAFSRIMNEGWLTVSDHEPLSAYYEGDITGLVKVDALTLEQRSFNAGVLGYNPVKNPEYRKTFEQAKAWMSDVAKIYTGDQALQNFAWYQHFGRLPPHSGYTYNQGVGTDGSIELGSTIIHLCGAARRGLGATKLDNQQKLWNAWPRGVNMIPIRETAWWQQSLPHPWPWINQCTQPRYRRFVREMRAASRCLLDLPWLVIHDPAEAFLIDREVLSGITRFWHEHAHRVADVLHRPTYHLPGHRGTTNASGSRWRRLFQEVRSHLPI